VHPRGAVGIDAAMSGSRSQPGRDARAHGCRANPATAVAGLVSAHTPAVPRTPPRALRAPCLTRNT